MARPIDTNAAARRIAGHLRGFARDLDTLVRGFQSSLAARQSAAGQEARGRKARPRRPLTAKDHARLKLQGQYLGLMRHLPKTHHARVKAVRAKQGYPTAIKLARRLAR